MRKSALATAQSLLRRRAFSKAITVLEAAADNYRDNFSYYLTAGIACLYMGDFGNAGSYFNQARRIRMTEVNLLLGQAVLYLRRGDTERAIQYYLDVLDYEPENKVAKAAMEFIRAQGNYETICDWVDSGKIQRFYPPLGVNPAAVMRVVLSLAAGVFLGMCVVHGINMRHFVPTGDRYDLTRFALSYDDLKNLHEKDTSGSVYRYILSDAELQTAHDNALRYIQDYRDNAALVEINRILNSNASEPLRRDAGEFMTYLEEPTFDTLTDNYGYRQVAADPVLYVGCWVAWEGSVSNALLDGTAYRFDLLVGYKPNEGVFDVEGKVPVVFPVAPAQQIDGSRSVRVLAKVGIDDGQIMLLGRSVYQPLAKRGE